MMEILSTCVACEQCQDVCPANAITSDGMRAVINEDLCIECGECMATCPMDAVGER